jgi:hypothetical protein
MAVVQKCRCACVMLVWSALVVIVSVVIRASFSCNSQRECNFVATTTLFGDACPENAKYLETQYECVEDGGTLLFIALSSSSFKEKFTIKCNHRLVSTTTSTTTADPTTLMPADHQNEATPSGVVDLIVPKYVCPCQRGP